MAIVEMKKLTLLAMRGDQDQLVRLMQRMGCVQIVELEEEAWAPYLAEGREGRATEQQARVRWAISELSRYGGEKKNLLASLRGKPELSSEAYHTTLEREGELMAAVEAAEANERASGENRAAITRLEALRAQLTPWQSLRTPLQDIGQTRHTVSELLILPSKELEGLRSDIQVQNLPAALEVVSQETVEARLLVVYHKAVAPQMEEILHAHLGTALTFPVMTGTVRQQLDELVVERRDLDARQDALRQELVDLSRYVGDLKILFDLLQSRVAREAVIPRFAHTESTFFIQAWVPAPSSEAVRQALQQASPTCAVELMDPLDEEKPPTLMQNGRVVTNFEGIVRNFSTPDPRGIDPTFMMTPFFACFFGMMLSDAGYGILLALLIPLLAFVIKPKRGEKKMLWVLGICGVVTIFWGAMFDTWFGASVHPMLLNPLQQPLEMMGLCLGVGAIHLFTGLGIAAYMNIKRGKPLDALFDQGFWFAMIIGLAMLLLPQTAAVGKWMAIVGVAGIILTAGRAKKNIFSRLIGGLGSLYNVTGWISDLLSYARLFGMGLATGVIGMVINLMVSMIMTSPVGIAIGIVILIFGHALNMGINTLGAYVHSCRLQYIEFFGKFFEDGGRPFSPLTDETRYVDLSRVE